MTRRSYQQGYVSEPTKTRQGVIFRIRYRVRNGDGGWTHKSETLHGLSGKKAARAVLDQRIRESENKPIETSEMTLLEFLDAYWRPYLERKQVKPSTKRSYQSGLNLDIIPKLGDLRLSEISPLHVEKLVNSKLEAGASPKTARNLLCLLQGIFSLAVDNDLIPRSPVRNRHKPQVTRRGKPAWTPELRAIVDAAPGEFRGLFQCAMLTGARLGELLGLQWKHIDLADRRLEIRQTLWEGQLLPPKTAGSSRTIYFGQGLFTALTIQKQNSKYIAPEDFVFCKADGKPLNPDVLRRDVLYPLLDRLGIPRTARAAGFHTFRHSAASIVNQETGNLKLAQRLLGHSNLSTTADVYTHTTEESERTAARALEQAIYGDLFQTVPQNENRNRTAALN